MSSAATTLPYWSTSSNVIFASAPSVKFITSSSVNILIESTTLASPTSTVNSCSVIVVVSSSFKVNLTV